MLTAFAGHSQATDTVCMPVKDAKRVLARLESLKVDSIELQFRRADIADLQTIISSQTGTVGNLRAQVSAEQLKSANLSMQITVLHKEVRRQKRNKVFAIIGGILTTSAMAFLFISK
jgi:hypothetical protein